MPASIERTRTIPSWVLQEPLAPAGECVCVHVCVHMLLCMCVFQSVLGSLCHVPLHPPNPLQMLKYSSLPKACYAAINREQKLNVTITFTVQSFQIKTAFLWKFSFFLGKSWKSRCSRNNRKTRKTRRSRKSSTYWITWHKYRGPGRGTLVLMLFLSLTGTCWP